MPSGRISDARMEHYTPCERVNISMSKDLYDRLLKFCEKEERGKSWTIQKALDTFLKKAGY